MITHERLLKLCRYDPATGILSARVRRGKILAGDNLGVKSGDRLRTKIDGVEYKVHRLVWFYVHSRWPEGEIDHINGNALDNGLANLREASHQQNMSNIAKPRTNKSGKVGVSWHAKGRRWQAHIRVNGVSSYLGLFDTVDAAHGAYLAAAQDMRGDFARRHE